MPLRSCPGPRILRRTRDSPVRTGTGQVGHCPPRRQSPALPLMRDGRQATDPPRVLRLVRDTVDHSSLPESRMGMAATFQPRTPVAGSVMRLALS
jgi:hypothetical protein